MGTVTWLNNGHEFWDQTLLIDLLKDYSGERDVYVVPGANIDVDEVNMEMKDSLKVTVIITSDEENKFQVQDLYHPDMRVLINYPSMTSDVDGYLPIGYCPQTKDLIKKQGMSAKSLDFFFAGQVTHNSRREMAAHLALFSEGGKLISTDGFAQGLPYEEYIQLMCRSKVIPCPEGYVSPDSFRLYEALEAGCIPIVRNKAFWTRLFGEVPFPIIDDWSELPDLIKHMKDRPDMNNKCQAWWLAKKRELRWIISQL